MSLTLFLPVPRRFRMDHSGYGLMGAGLLSLVLVLPTLVLLVTDSRSLDDEPLWLKPLKFQVSMAFFCLTIALATNHISASLKNSLWVRIPALAVSITAVYELVFLAIQAARGKRSHFNDETWFDQFGGAIMAAGASVLVIGAMIIGLILLSTWLADGWASIHKPLPLALALGLILGGALGGYTGSLIGMNAGPFVGNYLSTDAVMPVFGWSQTIGDLRIAHFMGLHAMQALPILALSLGVVMPAQFATVLITIAAGGWTVLTLAALSAAQHGHPPHLF